MYVLTLKWNKKTAAALIVAAALLLVALILLVANGGKKDSEDVVPGVRLTSCEKRVEYLASLGWTVDAASETSQDIVIPREFNEVYQKYNELQLAQGFDLRDYCGMDAMIYCYAVSNHPSGEQAIAQLILFADEVIGGDIHSTSLGGFMHGIKPQSD